MLGWVGGKMVGEMLPKQKARVKNNDTERLTPVSFELAYPSSVVKYIPPMQLLMLKLLYCRYENAKNQKRGHYVKY